MGKTFSDLRDRAAVEVIQKSTAALGLIHSPTPTERTTIYRDLDALVRFIDAARASFIVPPDAARRALAALAPWRTVAEIERLALAAECCDAIAHDRPVTIAQLGALTHRGRTQVFAQLQRQHAARVGRRIAARSARVIVATFRTGDTFSAGNRRTRKGQPQMMLQHRAVPKEGENLHHRSKAQKPPRREHCASPRRIGAHPPNGRARLNGRKARPWKGGAS